MPDETEIDAETQTEAGPDGPAAQGGRLVLVATPIGNLGDLTPRAVQVLADAAVVCCEDTRRTGRLLQHAGIRARELMVVNEHTEADKVPVVLRRLAAGEVVAVVSDAGVPGVSDPGERLVAAAIEAGHPVEAVPGASAALAALVSSGLPTGRFVFEGFLPRKGSGRGRRLAALADEERTVILYEAPHRLARTLADLVEACGPDRPVVVARELTKLHEEIWRGPLAAARQRAEAADPRGEHVVVLGGAAPAVAAGDAEVLAAIARHRASGESTRDAVDGVARELSVPRRRVYTLATTPPDASPPVERRAADDQPGS